MQFEVDVLALLLALQQVDIETYRLNKQLAELPQRAVIADCRKKKQVLQQKLDAIAQLKAKAESEVAAIEEEDARLAEKQHRLQQEIDQVQGDFRSVEARTKDLEGAAKRRETLEENLESAVAEIDKIEAVLRQATEMFEGVDAQEQAVTAEFVEQGTALKGQLAQLQADRVAIIERVPKEAVVEYQKVAERSNGVAISRLTDDACGACRSKIDEGRLAALKREGNVATCPNCKRMLVLR